MTAPAGRYRLEGVDRRGVPWCVKGGDDLELLLRRRDELVEEAVAQGRTKSIHWFVIDSDDGEAGFAEWCDECSLQDPHGTFGGTCGRCREAAAKREGTRP